MKITYGDIELKLDFLFWIAILAILFSDKMFLEIVLGRVNKSTGVLANNPEKIFAPLAVLISIIFYRRYSPFVKVVLTAALFYLIALSLESSLMYGSYFKYPHVFSKLLLFFPLFLMYLFPLKDEEATFKKVAFLIFGVFFVVLLVYYPHILSMSAFLSTDRGFDASSTYMLVIPCLFFFNKYFQKNSFFYLFCFFANFGVIIFLQHRSVWIATGVGLLVTMLMMKKATYKPHFQSYVFFVIIPLIIGFIGFSLVFSSDPDFINKLGDRADDIVNYKSEGTGSWRYEQFLSYWPHILDHPIFGMRLKGFELPIQFYHAEAGTAVFNDGTGHHFHSFYLDKLFYLGIVGLIICFSPVFYIIYKCFAKKRLTLVEMTLSAYAISGIFYGLSYWWPTFVYGFLGLCIALLDRKEEEEPEELESKSINTKPNLSTFRNEYV